jgi:glycosyltransferase involved in cell wall biosynthesis
MRIALTADPELPVPPGLYGGIERIVDMLAHGLVSQGHDVTVFAHPKSQTAGRLIPWTGRSSRSRIDTFRNSVMLARHVLSGHYDLVHSFSRIAYMLPILRSPIPKLMTYQRAISPKSIQMGHRLSGGSLWFSAVSRKMMENVDGLGKWRLVYNGVPLNSYDFSPAVPPDAPLVFLGRIEEIKGPHLAIDIAKRAGRALIIAGNIPTEHASWFDAHIAPHIDQKTIRYMGPVDDAAKNALLRGAAALLMPILWEEPFGIVMAEALACGTPVIGFDKGAVAEVVENGVTGFVADGLEPIVAAVAKISQIDRTACRRRAERLFSDRVVIESYLSVYREMIAASGRGVREPI